MKLNLHNIADDDVMSIRLAEYEEHLGTKGLPCQYVYPTLDNRIWSIFTRDYNSRTVTQEFHFQIDKSKQRKFENHDFIMESRYASKGKLNWLFKSEFKK